MLVTETSNTQLTKNTYNSIYQGMVQLQIIYIYNLFTDICKINMKDFSQLRPKTIL